MITLLNNKKKCEIDVTYEVLSTRIQCRAYSSCDYLWDPSDSLPLCLGHSQPRTWKVSVSEIIYSFHKLFGATEVRKLTVLLQFIIIWYCGVFSHSCWPPYSQIEASKYSSGVLFALTYIDFNQNTVS